MTAFITAAKNAFQGYYGTAPDETDQPQIEIVLDIVENLLYNYKVEEAMKGLLGAGFAPAKKVSLINEDIRFKFGMLTISKVEA